MTTRQRLEHIIIGTLLDTSGQKYHDECMILSPDMFSDENDRRIYGYIMEMKDQGKQSDINTIFAEYGEQVMDILPYMVELVADYPFDIIKLRMNKSVWLFNYENGTNFDYFIDTFADYLNVFFKLVYEHEER